VTAYVIAEIEVENADGYAEYLPLAEASIARHGGRFLVRGGKTGVFEGVWSDRIVILEFDSLDAARAWYYSDDYQAAATLRQANSRGRIIAVEGAAP
jgi:uncharacterized protein (DUF1330 family)